MQSTLFRSHQGKGELPVSIDIHAYVTYIHILDTPAVAERNGHVESTNDRARSGFRTLRSCWLGCVSSVPRLLDPSERAQIWAISAFPGEAAPKNKVRPCAPWPDLAQSITHGCHAPQLLGPARAGEGGEGSKFVADRVADLFSLVLPVWAMYALGVWSPSSCGGGGWL
jgi:hypothetical protein